MQQQSPDEPKDSEPNPITGEDPITAEDSLIANYLGRSEHQGLLGDARKQFTLDEAIEMAGHGKYQYQVWSLLALAWALVSSMTESCMPFIITGARVQWDLDGWQAGALGCGLVVGATVGSFASGWFCDAYGRRATIMVGIVWTLVMHALCAASPNWVALVAFRAIYGLGTPAVLNSSKVVVAEVFIAKNRGQWNCALHGWWQVGGMLLVGLTYLLDDAQWRLLILISSLPGISVIVLHHLYMRDTSRFLLEHNSTHFAAMEELEFAAECNNKTIPKGRLVRKHSLESPPTLRTMISAEKARSTFTILALFVLLEYGSWGNYMFFKEFYKRDGRDYLSRPAYLALFISKILGMCTGAMLIDIPMIGRRWLIPPGFMLAAVGTVLSVLLQHDVAVVLSVGLFGLGEEMCWVSLMTYAPEIYPARIRGSAVGVLFAVGRVGAIVSSLVMAVMMEQTLRLPFVLNGVTFGAAALLALTLHVETVGSAIDDDIVLSFEDSKADVCDKTKQHDKIG